MNWNHKVILFIFYLLMALLLSYLYGSPVSETSLDRNVAADRRRRRSRPDKTEDGF